MARRRVHSWLVSHYEPVRIALRRYGLFRALPVTVCFGVIWLIVGLLSNLPMTADAMKELVQYRGADITDGQGWRLLLSIFGAYHLGQSLWAGVLNTALVLAPLEARIGSVRTFVVLWAGHLVPTLVAFAVLSTIGPSDWLEKPDYGSSAALLATVAALAVVRRSWIIAGVLIAGLVGDVLLSDHLTAAEHWGAAVIGALLGLLYSRSGRTPEPATAHGQRSEI